VREEARGCGWIDPQDVGRFADGHRPFGGAVKLLKPPAIGG
jgi:hypothetical protein